MKYEDRVSSGEEVNCEVIDWYREAVSLLVPALLKAQSLIEKQPGCLLEVPPPSLILLWSTTMLMLASGGRLTTSQTPLKRAKDLSLSLSLSLQT